MTHIADSKAARNNPRPDQRNTQAKGINGKQKRRKEKSGSPLGCRRAWDKLECSGYPGQLVVLGAMAPEAV
jgi:hypothetical protein